MLSARIKAIFVLLFATIAIMAANDQTLSAPSSILP